jgi:hypothetical protein
MGYSIYGAADGQDGGPGGVVSAPYAGGGGAGQGYYRIVDLATDTITYAEATGIATGYTGGVRIIWGDGRSYPSNAANV